MLMRWFVQAVVWCGYCAFNLVIFRQFVGITAFAVTLAIFLSISLWVATEILRVIVLKYDWLVQGRRLAFGLFLLIPLLAAVIQLFIRFALMTVVSAGWIEPPTTSDFSSGATVVYWANTTLTLFLWTAAWLGFVYFKRYRLGEIQRWRTEAERQRLELDSLRRRLNPHFVFNTLNNLRALINEDTNAARDAVTRLSNTLRHALYHAERDMIALDDELSVVRDYLALEKMHYEERLRVVEKIDSEALNAELPPMLLQSLVENAIKHGIASVAGSIGISAEMRGSVLRLVVTSPGRLNDRARGSEPQHGDGGVGLAYLRAQLARLGDRASFDLRERNGEVIAELHVPQWEKTA